MAEMAAVEVEMAEMAAVEVEMAEMAAVEVEMAEMAVMAETRGIRRQSSSSMNKAHRSRPH